MKLASRVEFAKRRSWAELENAIVIRAARQDDEVVIVGRQGDEQIRAEKVARLAGTINYEVICGIAHRVPRIY